MAKKVSHQFAKRANTGVSVGIVIDECPGKNKALIEFPNIQERAGRPLRVRLYKHTCTLLYGATWDEGEAS